MHDNTFSEHRRAPRVAVDLSVLRRVDERFVPEKTLNLSATGVALVTGAPLVPGTLEQLTLVSRDGRVEVNVQAEVVRVQTVRTSGPPGEQQTAGLTRKSGTWQYVAGLKFAALDTSSSSGIEALMMGAMATPSGHRSGPRVELHTEAFWSGPGSGGATALQLVDLSQTGARIRGELVPPPAAQGLFSVRHEETGEMLTVPAEVVWRKNDRAECVAGLRFHTHRSATVLVEQLVRAFLFLPRPTPAAPSEQTGTRIGGFELGSLYARGRSVEVYRARALNPAADTDGAPEVALKHFKGEPHDVEGWTQRFLSAVELGRHLHEHPGVARVYSCMGDTRETWLATELVRGSSLEEGLAELARKGQHVPVDAVLSVVREVLTTLDDCHRYILGYEGSHLEVLHGDVRSSNVLIDGAGNVKVTGFGSPFRRTAEYLPWMPPEVLAGRPPTPQADLYQVGVLLYEALTGVVPFRADTADHLALAVSVGAVPPSRLNREVPQALDRLVLAAISEDPDDRPAGCAAFAEDLLKLELTPELMSASRRRLSLVRTREITAEREAKEKSGELQFHIEVQPPAPSPSSYKKGTPLTPWSPQRSALTPGEVVGRYTILGKLAEGGMGEVFMARNAEGATVVLKTVSSSQSDERDVVTRFLNEARLASIITHPNVAQIHDVGFDRGRPFIAMEYVAGHTLHDVLARLGERGERMAPALAAAIMAECCAGLDHAHALRVVHRDVSAKNIMLSFDGRVKVLDFGIARALGTKPITRPGRVRGTSGYVAPEQVKNDPVTGTADLWALGVNLYLLLTGAMPFEGANDFQVLIAITDGEPLPVRELRPEAPEALCEIIDRCLAKAPAARYGNAMAMRAELEKFLESQPAGERELRALMERLYPDTSERDRQKLGQYDAVVDA
ncbi:MAG: protein kinase [Myxococcaceae bacterium]|nr:protein kinase [Myxococcaceae bacterium]